MMAEESKYQVIIKYKKNMNLDGREIAGLLPREKYKLVLFDNGNLGTRAAFNVDKEVSKEEVIKDLTIKLFQRKPSIEIYSGTGRLN
jgi:hypothetical protein